jgi:hypothetical protein
MPRNNVLQTLFLVLGAVSLSLSMLLTGVGGSSAALAQTLQATQTISAKGFPAPAICVEYHFVITQVTGITPPDTITVTWSDGSTTQGTALPSAGGNAFYGAYPPSSDVKPTAATATIDSSWSGEFNLSGCVNGASTPTPTTTKTSTATATPTKTSTPGKSATATPTSTATATPTNTNTPTPTNTPSSSQPSSPTATPTNTNTPSPSSPSHPSSSAPTNTPVPATPTTVIVAQATQVPTNTPRPTAVSGAVAAQTLPKAGDPLLSLLRVLGVALIGLGLTTRFFARKR